MQQKVVVVAHEAIGMDLGVEVAIQGFEEFEEMPPIRVRPEHRPTTRAAVHDVIPSAGIFDTQGRAIAKDYGRLMY